MIEPADEDQIAADAVEAALDTNCRAGGEEGEREMEIEVQAEEMPAATRHDAGVTEEEEAAEGPASKQKASPAVVISPGIAERELPDGRIAFLAARDNEAAKARLSAACQGRARWQPLFQNWICKDDAAALEIRTIIKDQSTQHQEEHHA